MTARRALGASGRDRAPPGPGRDRAERSLALVRVPTDGDLSRAYHELAARGAPLVGRAARWPYRPARDEELVCLLAEMARYDARLLGALVELCLERWTALSPMALREAMRRMRRPQAWCVVVEFAREGGHDRELSLWANHVTALWPRVDPVEHFFVDDVRPGERSAARRAGRALAAYARWGFLAVERPTIDPHRKVRLGRYDARSRQAILAALVERTPSVTLAEYLEAIDQSVTRQQAIVDLQRLGLRPDRHGPGASWAMARRGPLRRARSR